MTGVFLSYSRSDHAMARQLVDGFRAVGIDVWWDEDMPGVDWQEELERRITDLSIVIVLWTPNSSNSKNVRDEARLGLKSEKLLNLLSGVAEPPFPFDRVNGLPLDGWVGMGPHHGWKRAVETVERLMVAEGFARPGEITGKLAARERQMGDSQAALDQAQDEFALAQTAEGDAVAASASADEALTRARTDLARAEELPLGPALVRAAQHEFDIALVAKKEADDARRHAKAQLSEASLKLSRCRAEHELCFSSSAAPAHNRPADHDRDAPRRSRSQQHGDRSSDLHPNSRSSPTELSHGVAKAPFLKKIYLPEVIVRTAMFAAVGLLVIFVALRIMLAASGNDSWEAIDQLMPSEPLSLFKSGASLDSATPGNL